MMNYNYFNDSFEKAINAFAMDNESLQERMDVLSIMIIINNNKDDDAYYVMMRSAIYGIKIGLDDNHILMCLRGDFSEDQMTALMDLIANGASDETIKMLKDRTSAYNMIERYDYIPHIDEVEEHRLAELREKRHNINHANLNDLTEMNNRRGFCSHYYFINNEPKSFITTTEHGNLYCKICHMRVSNFIANRLHNAIKNFDIDSDCTMPNTKHYNPDNMRKIGIIE